jgi:aspartyl-tRNA(Asn)/glutamyl-tRNA(Gln) amidotransferase subunit C
MDCYRKRSNSQLNLSFYRLATMSSLSRDEVAKLAALARIEMTEAELLELSSQFGMILDAVARVQEVDLSGVKATSHPQPLENVVRPDIVAPSLTPEAALSGAPAQEESRFQVPQILGEAE